MKKKKKQGPTLHRPMAHPVVLRYLSYSTTLADHAVHRLRRAVPGLWRGRDQWTYGPIWTQLDLLRAILSYLEPFEVILEPCGILWRYLKQFEAIWSSLDLFGFSLIYWEIIGAMWIFLGPFGDIWNHLNPFGAIWSHLEPYIAI